MKSINREQLEERLGDEGLTIVEVLDSEAFGRFHIPGAVNVPLTASFASEIEEAVPDKSQEVVVYCWDEDCDASPKAARQ